MTTELWVLWCVGWLVTIGLLGALEDEDFERTRLPGIVIFMVTLAFLWPVFMGGAYREIHERN